MKALVTGATGFIGSALVREVLKDGKEVRVLVRQSSNTRNIDGLEVEKAYGDVRDKEAVKAALEGCDTLYQTAALYELWGPSKKDYYDVNVEGTKASLQAALEYGVPKVVPSVVLRICRHFGSSGSSRMTSGHAILSGCWQPNEVLETVH